MIRPAGPEPARASARTRTGFIPTGRPDGGVRWLVRLTPGDAAAYDAAVARLTPTIERALGPEVVANRAVGRGSRPTSRLELWRPARTSWRRTLGAALASSVRPAVLVADVRRCYASIHPAILAKRLVALGADPQEVAVLRQLLERFADDGVRGLPVGPSPSAILANAVLAVVDEGLRAEGIHHVRWVDDVVAFPAGRRDALGAFDALRWALDRVGLEPHPSKTAILTDRDEVHDRLLRLRPSTGGASPMR